MEPATIEKYKAMCKETIKELGRKSHRLVADYGKIEQIFEYYEKYRIIIHRNMDSKDLRTKENELMDGHKIAAAFCCSFLKARPLSYVLDGSGVPPNFGEKWVNQHGAFLFGLQIVQDFWADKGNESGVSADDKEIYNTLIRFPKTATDGYLNWFIKLISNGLEEYFDFEKGKFEERLIFYISHIYFMLESYSYELQRANLLEKRAELYRQEAAKNTGN